GGEIMSRKKTYVADVERELYDQRNPFTYSHKTDKGLSPDIIREISDKKNEPRWMLDFRLKSLEVYHQLDLPPWGPDLTELDIDNIVTYVKPTVERKYSWEDIPQDIKQTFDLLRIPKAEHHLLAGARAQDDSEVVYHSIQESVAKQVSVYLDMASAVHEYEDLIREYFMSLVTPRDHKFAALHGAVWSGGSFVYVPSGVKVDIPLQSYFRSNAPGAGQFEHTLIIVEPDSYLHFIEGCSAPGYSVNNLHAGCVELFVRENSTLRYSTIENWSRNMFNLNTKRALVERNGAIEWVSG